MLFQKLKKKLTVTSFSRSREGIVDGAKCSFLRTHCLMILSRSRIEATLESGVPENVNGIEILGRFKRLKIDEEYYGTYFSKVLRSGDHTQRGISNASMK